jgi:predicted signal transduction protein with EAL and GGDEF domain
MIRKPISLTRCLAPPAAQCALLGPNQLPARPGCLDDFKEANKRFGHDAGDVLLRLAAERIRSCVRETDIMARLGGDEFTVILQDLTDTEHAEIVAGKIV